MQTVSIPTTSGSEIYDVYDIDTFPFDKLSTIKRLCNKRSKNKPRSYLVEFGTFDIETTTIKYPALTNKDRDIYKGFMYHWQICLGGYAVVGRYWNDLKIFFDKLKINFKLDHENRIVFYVHNLAFEWQFLYLFLKDWYGEDSIKCFATDKRKPIYCVSDFLEFRCSYRLTNMSLEKACVNNGGKYLKASGDLDYRKIRTAETILTNTELGYCVADVVALYYMIKSLLKLEHDTLDTIPLTNTGYIRRDTRNQCNKEKGYHNYFKKLAFSKELYLLMLDVARGGDTHASRYLANMILEDLDSLDMQSCYPAVMIECLYPVTSFVLYGKPETMEEFKGVLNKYACMFTITLIKPNCNKNESCPYIPSDKCKHLNNPLLDNGRVLQADLLTISITDIDYEIIERSYSWDQIIIGDMYISEYGELPKPIKDTVLKYYRLKTELKAKISKCEDPVELENLLYLYAKSKNRLNSIFGMCFTRPIHETVKQDMATGEWYTEAPDIDSELAKYFKSRNNFVWFPWGIWTTAHARKRLHDMIDIVNAHKDYSHAYNDTDSVKALNVDMCLIDQYNNKIIDLAERTGAYCDVDGERYYMGIFEKENKQPIKQFKTLGAKKYCYVDEKGLHVTVSGVNKKLGAKELEKGNGIYDFNEGYIFKEAGGLTLYYNDVANIYDININGCIMQCGSNIGMEESTYTLKLTDEYRNLLDNTSMVC